MPDDDREPDGAGQPQRGGGWISGPMNGGPDQESFGVYLTDDVKDWVRVNRDGHWADPAGLAEGDGPAG